MVRKKFSDQERAKKLAQEHSILPPAESIAAGPMPAVADKPMPAFGLPYRKRHPGEKGEDEGGVQ